MWVKMSLFQKCKKYYIKYCNLQQNLKCRFSWPIHSHSTSNEQWEYKPAPATNSRI